MVVIIDCATCGKKVWTYPSEIKKGRKFCSHKCFVESQKGKTLEERWGNEKARNWREVQRKQHSGKGNPAWKGGFAIYRKYAFDIYKKPKVCEYCGSTKNILIHHKDGNHRNLSKDNLKVCCKGCHNKKHGVDTPPWVKQGKHKRESEGGRWI